ncbi:MAG TPA: DUF1707 domain-containing protein [Solirubrobacteraceae bacterium]|jgi:hypothetical protein|nr:DUF1707 domain-containing protein [Solirubrobacteraceae bacterium]
MCRSWYADTRVSDRDVLRVTDQRERDAHVRASDEEREAATTELRRHAAEGRLTVEELDQRVETALVARERGELHRLLSDLPRTPRRALQARAARRAHVRVYLMVSLGLIALWALTGGGPFWPAWPLFGWGFWLFVHARHAGRRALRGAWPSLPAGRPPL